MTVPPPPAPLLPPSEPAVPGPGWIWGVLAQPGKKVKLSRDQVSVCPAATSFWRSSCGSLETRRRGLQSELRAQVCLSAGWGKDSQWEFHPPARPTLLCLGLFWLLTCSQQRPASPGCQEHSSAWDGDSILCCPCLLLLLGWHSPAQSPVPPGPGPACPLDTHPSPLHLCCSPPPLTFIHHPCAVQFPAVQPGDPSSVLPECPWDSRSSAALPAPRGQQTPPSVTQV